MPKPITPEEAETFFRFFYIATSSAGYDPRYDSGAIQKWAAVDPQFRSMRHEFFEGDLLYDTSMYRESDMQLCTVAEEVEGLNYDLITVAAYSMWADRNADKR